MLIFWNASRMGFKSAERRSFDKKWLYVSVSFTVKASRSRSSPLSELMTTTVLFEAPNEKVAMNMALKRADRMDIETLVAVPADEGSPALPRPNRTVLCSSFSNPESHKICRNRCRHLYILPPLSCRGVGSLMLRTSSPYTACRQLFPFESGSRGIRASGTAEIPEKR